MIFMIAASPAGRWLKPQRLTIIGSMSTPVSSSCPAPSPATALFAPLQPFDVGLLAVGDGHHLHYQQCGAADGVPLLFLHGGPGSGCSARQRQFFDPARWRAVLFDQRGCGRSLPRGSLIANTTAALLADIEALRRHLGIERWLVFGGSWGSTLALAYCARHPDACLGAILRGIFFGGQADIDWFFHDVGVLLPDAWQDLCAPVAPVATAAQLTRFYLQAPFAADPQAAADAVRRWMNWEAALCAPGRTPSPLAALDGEARQAALDKYRIQAHYLAHECFLGEAEVLECARRIAGLPVALLHGKLDFVCRSANALRLHQTLPGSRLRFIDEAGHNPFDAPMTKALIEACDHFLEHGDFSGWGARFAGAG